MSTSEPMPQGGYPIRTRAQWDEALFAEVPRRAVCARLKSEWPTQPVAVRVHRNHAFEHVGAATSAWGAYAGLVYEWSVGGYDDSLAFAGLASNPAVELVWYDALVVAARLGEVGFADWFLSRLAELRRISTAPILVCLVGAEPPLAARIRDRVAVLPGVRLADIDATVPPGMLYDERVAKLSGSRLSETANMAIARRLGASWLPSLVSPRLKAVVVDLDHTLYQGVLGEDGLAVVLTPGHLRLQEVLAELRESGVFLGMVSRNDERDVRALFAARQDFPLKWDDFTTLRIGWGAKSEALRAVCGDLRIGADAILYVDDNLGELLEVAASIPAVHLLHAKPDAGLTARALQYFPGLWSWGKSEADLVRQSDLQANLERDRLGAIAQSDPHAYFRELAPAVTLRVSPSQHAGRMHELSQKTNQFNLALRRLSEVEVARYLSDPDAFAVAISLRDRLSDSGMIAAMFGRVRDGVAHVEEWVISCRALGRGLEDYMARQALLAAVEGRSARRVTFAYRFGPRNQPARDWLKRFASTELSPDGGEVSIDLSVLTQDEPPISLTIERHGHS